MDLRNHCLLAMPHQTGYFASAMIVLCEHDENGALGFVVNQPMTLNLAKIMDEVGLAPHPDDDPTRVYSGGPVETGRGFVLSQHAFGQATQPFAELYVSGHSSDLAEARELLHNHQALFVLGYAGWDAGQLDQEMADNAWLSLPYDPKWLFQTPCAQRYDRALAQLGIQRHQLSHAAGRS